MANISILQETFDLYEKKAKELEKAGEKTKARRYYYLAAEQMLKLAKESKGELQKVRFERAKSLIQYCESLPQEQRQQQEEKVSSDVPVAQRKEVTLEEALASLNNLVGLSKVKAQIADWVEQIQAFQTREKLGLKVPDYSYHMVFLGNPGTGKTTVARLIADIYRALGILKTGQVVEVSRPDLVAPYVGQTAIKTKQVIQKAYGGVLFIDEAYSLAQGSENDFGQEAIDTLVKEMEDHRDNLVVIVAGYEGKMKKFIDANEGLSSRFKTFLSFEDYNGEELLKIFLLMAKKNEYNVEKEAIETLFAHFNHLYQNRDKTFGNGRDVRNLFEQIITIQSKRVNKLKTKDIEQMMLITKEDLPFRFDAPSGREESKEETLLPEEHVLEGGGKKEYTFLWDNIPEVSFEDIAGLDGVKELVRRKVILPLKEPESMKGYVSKGGGGLLLYGPPGTGKTMIAAAIAHEISAKFCAIKPSDLLTQGVGNTEKAVKELFLEARDFPCAVIYFDEMDSLSPKSTRSSVSKQLRSELLAQLQGVDSYQKKKDQILFLIASTNKPWDIDSAFLRPGRFGTKIYVGLPDDQAREYLIRHRLEKIQKLGIVQVSEEIDVEEVVKKTNGFNGSDMTNLLDQVEETSRIRGSETGVKEIIMADFLLALEAVSSSVMKEDIEKLLAWQKENG